MTDETYELQDIEKIAWAAGWFEGEGSTVARTYKGKPHLSYMRLSGDSTDLDTLQRIQSYIGGSIKGPKMRLAPSGEQAKPIWTWAINDTKLAREAALKLQPFLSSRRSKKIDDIISQIKFYNPPTSDERFWSLVIKEEKCWLWVGYIDKYGFGTWLYEKNKRKQAHRYSYEAITPTKAKLKNLCGTKHCVNPEHWEQI